ncbi:MAG TPA: hypothetical protein VL094_01530 [Sphingomonadaceae bacterium]|nr:hypothetical protein [Sphingomonadaceae bacterium]
MGLHVSSVAQVVANAPQIQGIGYFIYFLNYYNIEDDIMQALLEEIPHMEEHFSELGNAVAVSSVKNIDFADEVLSWHNVFGVDASEVCPAILICTLPPQHFQREPSQPYSEDSDVPWVLLSLREHCRTVPELKSLLRRVVEEVSKSSDLSDFSPTKLLKTNEGRPVISGELTYMGIKLHHSEIFKRIGDIFKR